MRLRLAAFLFAILSAILSAVSLIAQTPDVEPNRTGAPVPVVTFDLSFPGADPAHYSISVESTCRAAYRSDNPENAANDQPASDQAASAAAATQPYTTEFTMSESLCRQVFELAKQAHYFQGNFDYKGRIAQTGIKTLTYSEGPQTASLNNATNGKQFKTTYNYSQNPAIQQLTTIFQNIASTAEFGNRLAQEHRYDRMSLEGELKRMEEMHKSHQLLEIQSIAPVLQAIANDSAVFNVTRQRAIRLLKSAGVNSTR
jgi:hypothetical protein